MAFIFIMILYLCVLTFIVSYNGRLPKWQTKSFLILIAFSLAVIGACVKPISSFDLYRHFQLIDGVRKNSDSFAEIMGNHFSVGNYEYTYVFNFLVYLIAKLLPNQALPFIGIAVPYGIFAYILLSEFEKKRLTSRNVLLSLAMFSILMPYVHIYSGIRNTMASAIAGFGMYAFYKSKNVVALFISTIVAALIHPASIALLPFIFLSLIKPGVKGFIAIAAFPSMVSLIINYIQLHSSNDFLAKVSWKYYNYTHGRIGQINQGRILLYSIMITLILVSILALGSQKARGEAKKRSHYFLNVIIWYAMFSLGYWKIYQLSSRLPYNIAVFSPVLVNMLFNGKAVGRLEWYTALAGECVIYSLSLFVLYRNIRFLMLNF